jgi:hypothetical protein
VSSKRFAAHGFLRARTAGNPESEIGIEVLGDLTHETLEGGAGG